MSLLLAGAAALASPAAANPFDTLGAGPRHSAMLAGTSVARGAESAFLNPAGLARGPRDAEISFGVQYTHPGLEVNGRDVDEEELATTWLGVRYPTQLFGQDVAIGAVVSIPFQRVSRLLALPLDQPQFLYYGTRNQRLVVLAGVGTEIVDGVRIGAGVQTLLDTSSEPDFTLVQDPDAGNDETDPIADRAEAQSFGFASAVQSAVLAPVAGVTVGPFRGFELSFVYRGGVQASLSAPFRVTIEELELLGLTLAETVFVLPNDAQVFFSPNELGGGISWRDEQARLEVGLDVTWYDWSDFPATFSEATPSLTGGLSEVILPVPAFLPIRPPARDTVVPALGVEWQPLAGESADGWLRAGYSYRMAMVDRDRSLTNYLDANTHVLGFGGGLLLREWSRFVPKPLSLDAYLQAHVLEERSVRKDDPASSPFGDLVVTGLVFGGGVSATIRF